MAYKPITIVDEEDKVIGQAMYEEIITKGMIFRSSNVMVFNSKGDVFVHKRSKNLPTHPGMWDVKLGGIVDAGETYEDAAKRELEEEAGIKDIKLEFMFSLKFRSGNSKNNRKVYRSYYDGEMKLQEEEIEEGRFMTMDEIEKLKNEGKLSRSAEAVLEEYLKWENQKK